METHAAHKHPNVKFGSGAGWKRAAVSVAVSPISAVASHCQPVAAEATIPTPSRAEATMAIFCRAVRPQRLRTISPVTASLRIIREDVFRPQEGRPRRDMISSLVA